MVREILAGIFTALVILGLAFYAAYLDRDRKL
jgi:hypothetical protein